MKWVFRPLAYALQVFIAIVVYAFSFPEHSTQIYQVAKPPPPHIVVGVTDSRRTPAPQQTVTWEEHCKTRYLRGNGNGGGE